MNLTTQPLVTAADLAARMRERITTRITVGDLPDTLDADNLAALVDLPCLVAEAAADFGLHPARVGARAFEATDLVEVWLHRGRPADPQALRTCDDLATAMARLTQRWVARGWLDPHTLTDATTMFSHCADAEFKVEAAESIGLPPVPGDDARELDRDAEAGWLFDAWLRAGRPADGLTLGARIAVVATLMIDDHRRGNVPADAACFADLHHHVNANAYLHDARERLGLWRWPDRKEPADVAAEGLAMAMIILWLATGEPVPPD